jgi:hypothetical protein
MFAMKKTMMLLVLPLLALSLVAQEIPIQNWSSPPTFKPAGTIGAMADISPGIPFVATTPCRVYDSRSATILSGGGTRTVNMDGGTCGLPSGAEAYSIHVTAFGSAASTSYGFITIYPAGTTRPVVSTMNFLGGSQTSSAAVVPSGSGFDISVYTTMTTHFVIDVNGYYTAKFPTTNQFVAESTSAAAAILGLNGTALAGAHAIGGYAGGAAVVHGIQGQAGPATLGGSSGIHGINNSPAGSAFGVFGHTTATSGGPYSSGVRGRSDSTGGGGIGVWGSHAGGGFGGYFTSVNGFGVVATTGASNAIWASSATDAIFGQTTASSGRTYGVWGHTSNATTSAAGVLGTDNDGKFDPAYGGGSIGVVGLSRGSIGVFGVSTDRGVQGSFGTVTSGTFNWDGASGVLGYSSTSGVHAFGNVTATGTKPFVEPHPTEAGAVITYIALEGPEAGTYFRGRGRFVGGRAVIQVPDHFRFTTVDDGLTVQITPIGDFAQVAVTSTNLNSITVKSSKDVEFYYQVHGVRQAHPRHRPIEHDENRFFVPASADDRLEHVYGEENRRRLVANGTFNEDGSVNVPTAERLGWAQQWREREAAERKASEAAAAIQVGQQQQ